MVVYRDGGLPELVRDGRDGLVVPPGDVAAMAAAIARLASDDALRARLGVSARARAQDFSHERFVASMTALYRELLSSTSVRTRIPA